MAPKKKAVAKTSRSNRNAQATPATVTSNRGKAYEITAAASRPTRAAAPTKLSFLATSLAKAPRKRGRSAKPAAAPVKRRPGRPPKSATASIPSQTTAQQAKRGPGRPNKSTVADHSPPAPAKRGPGRPSKTVAAAVKRRPGRPPKSAITQAPPQTDVQPTRRGVGRPPKRKAAISSSPAPGKRGPGRPAKAAAVPVKRGPGRPPKSAPTSSLSQAAVQPMRRGPGRPPKSAAKASTVKAKSATKPSATSKKRGRPATEVVNDEPPKKRGRPSRASMLMDAVPPEDEQPTPKRRGAPPYGGETTKLDADDDAAAEQLEEELQEDLTEPISAPMKHANPEKGKGKARQTAIEDDALQPNAIPTVQGRQYWLMKAEQDGHDVELANGTIFNTKFTIDDLRSKTEPEPWDGVRNPTAAKNMRAMKQGDLAFFYASGGKMPGIVGTMEIVREASADITAHDKNSAGYVADAAKRDRWCVVHVEFRQKLSKPITRTELVAAKDQGPLAKMQEFTAARLSVSKVSQDEWDYIHSLIEDNEASNSSSDEEDEEPVQNGDFTAGQGVLANGLGGASEHILEGKLAAHQNVDPAGLPVAPSGAPVAIMAATEDLPFPTTDILFSRTGIIETSETLAVPSSRPTSRSSRASSAPRRLASKAASRTGSRAGSVPRTLPPSGSRARSTTPQHRAGSVEPSSGGAMDAIGEE